MHFVYIFKAVFVNVSLMCADVSLMCADVHLMCTSLIIRKPMPYTCAHLDHNVNLSLKCLTAKIHNISLRNESSSTCRTC